MSSRTISLEEAAYARLRAAKRPGESFTDVVNRLTRGEEAPSFDMLWGLLGGPAPDVADAMEKMRADEIEHERRRWSAWGWEPTGERKDGAQ